MAFGTDESVLFIEVSLIQGVLIERFHCMYIHNRGVLNPGVVKYTNVAFGTDESVLFIEVSL